MKDVIELAKQAGIRWDTDIDRSEWLVRRSELENLVALVRNAALDEAQNLGLTFFVGNAYISRAYIDAQDDLNKRIEATIKKIESQS